MIRMECDLTLRVATESQEEGETDMLQNVGM